MTLLSRHCQELNPWPSRPVHCYSFAPLKLYHVQTRPHRLLLVSHDGPRYDLDLAASDLTASLITSIVFGHDLISRLSLRSVRRLKLQMRFINEAAQRFAGLSRHDVLRSHSEASDLFLRDIASNAGTRRGAGRCTAAPMIRGRCSVEAFARIEDAVEEASDAHLFVNCAPELACACRPWHLIACAGAWTSVPYGGRGHRAWQPPLGMAMVRR